MPQASRAARRLSAELVPTSKSRESEAATINYQLSIINYQLSIINYQLVPYCDVEATLFVFVLDVDMSGALLVKQNLSQDEL